MRITKPIDIVDIIEKLYKLDSQLDGLPRITGGKINFNVTIDSIGDAICIAEQFNVDLHEPTPALTFHWMIIPIGDNINLNIETNRELYQITY